MNKVRAEIKPRVAIVTDLLSNHKCRIFSATFIEKDGSVRNMNARFDKSCGKGMNHDPAEFGHQVVKEIVQARNHHGKIISSETQYRTVNFNTLLKLKFNKKVLIAREGNACA